MANSVDKILFEDLAEKNPEDVCRRALCEYDKDKKCCENLDGVPLDMADAAYVFKITPRIPVAVLYWAGDDDFPADSKLLYDKSITEHLASDIVFALAIDICARVGIKT